MLLKPFVNVGTVKPEYEVADVFRAYGEAYRQKYQVTYQQAKVMTAIMQCRTAALGGHVEECPVCGGVRICYNPCDNRHCPKCGAFEKARWLEERKASLLPIPYFHVVFTTDHAINPLVRANQKAIYDLLFQAATETLKAYGQEYLGGEIGITAVLHTWGEDLGEHIHLHGIVTGGALQETEEGARWQPCLEGFLFPIVKLSRDYRDAFCEGLARLHRRGELKLAGECEGLEVKALAAEMRAKKWEVYVKEAYAGPEQVYDYLGRYVNRIALSNYRLVAIGGGKVSFTYHDNKDGGREKVMTLTAVEFIRRFLLHVLPRRYVRIRYYGLHHSSKRAELMLCRKLLGLRGPLPSAPRLVFMEWLLSVVEKDPRLCPFCGQGVMVRRGEFGPLSPLWLWVLALLGIAIWGRVVR